MAEHNFSVENTLTLLLDDKKYHSLRDILSTMNPADIAAVFDELPESRLPLLFRLLPKELAAETFVEMDTDAQALLIRGFSDSELKEVIDELYVDDAVDIVEEMPANVVQRILTQADPEMRKQINEILRYPEDSAGSIMTTEYVSLRPNMTVGEAILRIRRTGIDKETIYTCYVTKGHKLIGLVSVKDLLLCEDDNATIESIMTDHVITVGTLDDQEQVAQMFSKYDFLALPVVDTENRLVGIVTFDDAMDVMQDEATEDMEKMAAMLPSEHPYLRSSPFEIWKNRIPWLMLLMISATLTGLVITSFEDALGVLPCLTAFIPMLMDTGGNSGSQACVTVIRGISLDEIEFRDIFKVVWKEIRVAVLCGICLAIACFGKIMLVDHMLLKSESVTTWVALVVSLSMEEIIDAAKRAEIYDDILAMPDGFDTYVGERGTLLSGGQKQRISIARIFLKNPPILILDEATSALDSLTEAKIQHAFDELAKDRTTLIIAHRLSTIRAASRILVVSDGRIVESGTHAELMQQKGVYANLCNTQNLFL